MIIFKKLRFQNVFRPHENEKSAFLNSSGKSFFSQSSVFGDGLVWTRRKDLKTEVLLWKHIKSFPSTLRRRNLKTQQSPLILDLCLRKTPSGKSHDYREYIVFEKRPFSKCFPSTRKRKARVFKFFRFELSVFEELLFRDGLMWTVGLTVEIKLRFQIPPA